MMQQMVEQPKDEQKDKILLANNCVFSQQQFLGSKGKTALSNEEISGVVANVYAAMDEYAKMFVEEEIYRLKAIIKRLWFDLEDNGDFVEPRGLWKKWDKYAIENNLL